MRALLIALALTGPAHADRAAPLPPSEQRIAYEQLIADNELCERVARLDLLGDKYFDCMAKLGHYLKAPWIK